MLLGTVLSESLCVRYFSGSGSPNGWYLREDHLSDEVFRVWQKKIHVAIARSFSYTAKTHNINYPLNLVLTPGRISKQVVVIMLEN